MEKNSNTFEQPAASSQLSRPRRSAWAGARESAIEAARRNALHECPYRDPRWRGFWLREFEHAQQLQLSFNN